MDLLLVVLAAVWVIVQLALNKEYDYWSPRLGVLMIRAASLLLPLPLQDRYQQEWLAEHQQAIEEGGQFSFPLLVVLPAAVVLAGCWYGRLACRLARGLAYALEFAVGVGLRAGGIVGLGGLMGGLLGALLAAGLTVAGLGKQHSALLGALCGALLLVGLTLWLGCRLIARWPDQRSAAFSISLTGLTAGLTAGLTTLGAGLGVGMAVGTAIGLGSGLTYGLTWGPLPGLVFGMAVGIGGGLIYGLAIGLAAMVVTGLAQGLSAWRLQAGAMTGLTPSGDPAR